MKYFFKTKNFSIFFSTLVMAIMLIGCGNNGDDELLIEPEACFSFTEQTYTLNDSILFFNCSEFSSEYHWIFDDESTSDSANPTYLFETPGEKNVKLICSSVNGEVDSISKLITVMNEKYFNIDEEDNIRVYPVAMKVMENGIYVVSGKYNIDGAYSVNGTLEKYDFQFKKQWEKSLGLPFGNPPKGDMFVTSDEQIVLLLRVPSNPKYQFIYLMDTVGNTINKQELYHYYINGMVEYNDELIFCGHYLSGSSQPYILKTDKNLNTISNTYYSKFGYYASFLDITNNGNLVVLGQVRDSDEKTGSGNYFLYSFNSSLDSISFSDIPIEYNFSSDNNAKLRSIDNDLYFYDYSTIYNYDTSSKTLNSKQIGTGYLRAFDLFENRFVLFNSEKTFTYDLDFNLIKERGNLSYREHRDYFIDIEKFSEEEYLLLGSYNKSTNTSLGYAEHLRFFIYGKE